jgi:hypothetical protein
MRGEGLLPFVSVRGAKGPESVAWTGELKQDYPLLVMLFRKRFFLTLSIRDTRGASQGYPVGRERFIGG